MVSSDLKILLAAAAVLVCTSAGLQAVQADRIGRVTGIVVDASSGETLAEAAVGLLEADCEKARSDASGRFELKDVPAGTYTLRVFKAGYVPLDLPGVVVSAENASRVEVALQSRTQAGAAAPVQLPVIRVVSGNHDGPVRVAPVAAAGPCRAVR